MSDKLPSIDDFYEELPSIDEIIKEEKELPSVDEFVEKEEEEIPDTAPCSIEEEVEPQDLTEVIRLINDVRKDIPDIPEIKYYDEQLEQLTSYIEGIKESIPEIPEQKTYDVEIETVCNLIDELKEEVRTNAADIPEIKYYDEEIGRLTHRLNSLPEIRHYEGNLTSLKEDILAVKESIPQFPKWVNEVNEVPDFSWIGKTFGVIDSDFV